MIRTKVVEALKTFSREEIKQFGGYLSSPLITRRASVSELLEIYRKYHPEFGDKNFTKEKVFRKLFPGKPYSDEVFRNLNSQLLKHAEDFLSYLNYSGDTHAVKKHLLSELLRRNILSLFEKNLNEALQLLQRSDSRDIDYFLKSHELLMLKDLYNSYRNDFVKPDIQSAEKDLIAYFVMKILEIQNYIQYECRLLGIDRSLFLSEKFTDALMKNLPEEIRNMPQVSIHYNALMLEKTGEKEYYTKLHELVAGHGDLLERPKRYNKYIDLIDYLKRTGSMSDPGTVKEIFDLRREIIEKQLFTENFMTNMFFLNMVKSGSRLGEYEWVGQFIKKYHKLVSEDYRNSASHLGYAILYFEMKKFDDAMSHLALVRYEDSQYNLEVRNLTARIFYERNETDMLNDCLNSYRIYVSKNRMLGKPEAHSHAHFISVLGKLSRIRESGKLYKIDELMPEESKQSFVNKAWIMEKIKELEM